MVDHTVTRRDWYDFFLVSQHVGQGTVSPTHYVVLRDSLGLPVDAVQRIRFVIVLLCHILAGSVGTSTGFTPFYGRRSGTDNNKRVFAMVSD